MLKRIFFSAIILSLFVLSSCLKDRVKNYTPKIISISKENPSLAFSVNLISQENISVIYGEYNSSSLYEARINKDLSIKRTFIDTIDRTPPINPHFGVNTSLITDRESYILYSDQQTEEDRILKFLYSRGNSLAKARKWYTDVLLPSGNPIAILETSKIVIPVWERENNLYYLSINKAKLAEPISIKPVRLKRDFSLVRVFYTTLSPERNCFFAFDRLTGAIYQFRWRASKLDWKKIETVNSPIYYIRDYGENTYNILFYNNTMKEIDYIKGYPENNTIQRVTLSRQTTSLSFTEYEGREFFFFNELTLKDKTTPVFTIGVIYPSKNRIKTYRKCILVTASKPINRISWIFDEQNVYIVYHANDSLYMAYLDLTDLIKATDN